MLKPSLDLANYSDRRNFTSSLDDYFQYVDDMEKELEKAKERIDELENDIDGLKCGLEEKSNEIEKLEQFIEENIDKAISKVEI